MFSNNYFLLKLTSDPSLVSESHSRSVKRTGSRSRMNAHALGCGWFISSCASAKHHGDYRLSSVHSSSLPAQCCLDCSRVLYTPLLHCLCYRTTRERRRAASSREESAQRVPGSPQRHKRERNLRENHHFKRKNNRASQQRAVRSVNVCTELNFLMYSCK